MNYLIFAIGVFALVIPNEMLSWPKFATFCAGVSSYIVMTFIASNPKKSEDQKGLEELRTELSDLKDDLSSINMKLGLQAND